MDLDVKVVTTAAATAAKLLMEFRTVLNSSPEKDPLKSAHSRTPHLNSSAPISAWATCSLIHPLLCPAGKLPRPRFIKLLRRQWAFCSRSLLHWLLLLVLICLLRNQLFGRWRHHTCTSCHIGLLNLNPLNVFNSPWIFISLTTLQPPKAELIEVGLLCVSCSSSTTFFLTLARRSVSSTIGRRNT